MENADAADPIDPVLLEFLLRALEDLQAAELRPLEHYLAIFPGYEGAIAQEYRRLEAQAGSIRPAIDADSSLFPADIRRHLGHYRLLRELGRGGQGVVFLAIDERLDRQVALKILPTLLGRVADRQLARLQREAEIVSQLEHPAICAVYEVDFAARTPFIAMRYADGLALSTLLHVSRSDRAEGARLRPHRPRRNSGATWLPCFPANRRELGQLLVYFEETARALHVAHEAGVVHRDIKPSNLMVSPEGRPVILDFGLAHRDDDTGPTLTGEVLGTPAYMSPEQLQTGIRRLDRRADVFSLAVVLFECLTLRRPFEAESQHGICKAILEEPLPDPRRLNPVIGTDLAIVLATALEKDPARRYLSSYELAEELRRVRQYEPIQAKPAGYTEKLWRWSQRHPRIAVSSLAAFLLLSLLSAISLYLWVKAEGALGLYRSGYWRDESATLRRNDPPKALAAAILAAEAEPGHASNATLLDALAALYHRRLIFGRWKSMDFAATGRALALGGMNGEVAILDPESGEELQRFSNDAGPALCVRFAPNGGVLATGFVNGTIRLRTLEGDSPALILEGHSGSVESIAFEGSGRRLITSSSDKTARIWDAITGDPLVELRGHTGAVMQACFSADGLRAATASSYGNSCEPVVQSDDTARVWDATSGRELFQLPHGDRVTDVVFLDARGGRLITCSYDERIRIYDLEQLDHEGVPTCRAFELGGKVFDIDLRPGTEEVTVGHDLGASLFELASGTRWDFPSHGGRAVTCVGYSPEGGTLVTAARDGFVRFWDSDRRMLLRASMVRRTAIEDLRWSPRGSRVALLARERESHLVYGGDRPYLLELTGHSDSVASACFDRKGERLLTSSRDGTARLWEVQSGRSIRVMEPGRGALVGAALSPDERSVLVAAEDGSVHLFDARQEGRAERKIESGSEPLLSAVFSTDGGRVLTASRSGRVVLWDLGAAGSIAFEHGAEIECARLSPDGRWLATGGRDRTLRIWSIDPGKRLEILSDGGKPNWEWLFKSEVREWRAIFDVIFEPSGRALYATCENHMLLRVDLTGPAGAPTVDVRETPQRGRLAITGDGKYLVGTLKWSPGLVVSRTDREGVTDAPLTSALQHTNQIVTLCVSERGHLAVTGSSDGTAKVWLLDEMKCWVTYPVSDSPVRTVAITRDGSLVATGDDSGGVRLWPVDVLPTARAALPASDIADLLGDYY